MLSGTPCTRGDIAPAGRIGNRLPSSASTALRYHDIVVSPSGNDQTLLRILTAISDLPVKNDATPAIIAARLCVSSEFSDANFKQPSACVLAPPRELDFQFSPLDFEGRWSAERRALVVQKAPFGRSIAGFVAKGPHFRGLGCLAARRFPAAACPRPANFSGRASYWARTVTPQASESGLRGTAADAASDRFGLPLPGQAFALSHFSNASRSAPHWTGRER